MADASFFQLLQEFGSWLIYALAVSGVFILNMVIYMSVVVLVAIVIMVPTIKIKTVPEAVFNGIMEGTMAFVALGGFACIFIYAANIFRLIPLP